jgi:hypothetical protein
VVEGAWWEHVDTLARRVGNLLRRDAWRRRRDAAVESGREPVEAPGFDVCRLGLRAETDLTLLYDCVEPNLDDPEFFGPEGDRPGVSPPCADDPGEVDRHVREHPLQPALAPRGDQGPRAAPRRPRPLDRARRYEGGGASGSAGGSTTLLNLTVPSVRKIAVKPTITFTTVSVSFIPTLKARSVERATPTSRKA